MKEILFDKEGHLTEETLNELKLSILNDKKLALVLEHISECQKCADIFANSFKENELEEAPLGFQEEVQMKLKGKKQSKIEFDFYCIKIAVAASIALVMLFSNGLDSLANSKINHIKPMNLNCLNSINSKLNNFSERIIKLEVLNNDKEKK